MPDFKTATILLICLYLVWQLWRGSIDLLDALIFLLPFKSVSFEVGLSLYIFHIPIILMLLYKVWFLDKMKMNVDPAMLWFVGYVVVSTVVVSNLFIEEYIKNKEFPSFFREEGRYISSLIKFIVFDFGILFAVHTLVRNEEKILKLIRIYLRGLVLLAVLGMLQVVVSVVFHVNLFPTNFFKDGRPVVDLMDQVTKVLPFVRLTSLGGEPKNIASSLAIGIMLLYYLAQKKITFFQYQRWLIPLFIVCILFTLSTSGIGLVVIFFVVSLLLDIPTRAFWRIRKSSLYALPLVIAALWFSWPFVSTIIEQRVVERSKELTSEEVDEVIQKFLVAQPSWAVFGTGLGNVHNLAAPYFGNDYYVLNIRGKIFTSRYGYIKLISENGVVGFLLFSFAFLWVAYRVSRYHSHLAWILFRAILITVLFYYARANYVFSELMFITGLGLAYLKLQTIE